MTAIWNLLRAPLRAIGAIPRTVAGLTLPGRIAFCVAVFQILIVLLAVAVVVVGDDEQVFEAWLRPTNLAVVALLLVMTPVLAYHAAKLWLEHDVSRFPDILEAWREGLASLRRQGIDPRNVPVFLVIGARSDDEERLLLGESPCEFTVIAAPQGDAALHVYGGPDAVFVCLATCSRLSASVRNRRSRPAVASSLPPPAAGNTADDIRGTVMVMNATPEEPRPIDNPRPVEDLLTHTIDIGQVSLAVPSVPSVPSVPPMSVARDEVRDRFNYFCSLLRGNRAGLAPLNGIIAALPGDLLMSGATDPQTLGQALCDDLATALAMTGVKAPLIALVVGLEHEPGFVELIGRMPATERAGRLGQRFPVGLVPSYEQAVGLARRACGMVEDLVMGRLFRSEHILTTANNDRLAALVARLRGNLFGKLAIVLRRALLVAEGETSDRAPFIAGCYLAACGEAEGTRAFLRGVLDRMLDCQGDLEWTQASLEADVRAVRTARVLWAVTGVLLSMVGVMVLGRWWKAGG